MTNNTIINWRPGHLEDDIVKIIPILASDFENLFEVASDPFIWEQHPEKDRYKKEIFQVYFDGAILGNTAFVIIDKASNEIIGSTRYYDYKQEDASIAIGYTFLSRPFWGGLHNQSTKKLLLDYAFRFIDKVYFHIGATNIRSQLAVKKIGAIKVREFDSDNKGQQTQNFEYVIQKQDWENKIK